jgi:manganese transport protein
VLFILAEIAIAATDLAEVIGSAIALNLLFGLPIWAGVLITALDCLFLLVFEQRTFRTVELLIAVLTFTIAAIYAAELFICKPDWALLVAGYLPSRQIVLDPAALYVAIGILGATVMPHNLYLHSSIIQTRAYPRTQEGKWAAIQYGTIDATLSLVFAFLINSAILALAAAAFYYGDPPHREVAEIGEAYVLLAPTLSSHAAAVLFGIALLASGQQSTITGTLAGQVVMEGFLDLRMRPWLQRLLTRAVAIVPAVIVAGWMGEAGMNRLLILSQVVLSLQLSFATIPLVYLTSRRSLMGPFVNSRPLAVCGAVLALFIAALNIYLVVSGARNGSFAL